MSVKEPLGLWINHLKEVVFTLARESDLLRNEAETPFDSGGGVRNSFARPLFIRVEMR